MPDKCAIVGCHTNYSDGQKRSVFYFPKDEELRSKWIRFVNRINWSPGRHSVICVSHFEEKFIQRHKKKTMLKDSHHT